MGSALLNTTAEQEFAAGEESASRTGRTGAVPHQDSPEALRAQVAERLAAHRRRRAGEQTQSGSTATDPARPVKPRSAQIAAAVAERYAHTQSYRAFLAAEAERAIQQARAAAEVAAMNAQAVAAAQQRLLKAFDEQANQNANHEAAQAAEFHENGVAEAPRAASQPAAAAELNLWPDLEPGHTPQHKTHHRSRTQPHPSEARASNLEPRTPLEPRTSNLEPPPGLTVRLYEDAASAAHVDLGPHHVAPGRTNRPEERNDAEARALDDEIAFRQAPVFEEPAGPPVPLPANLIEFPRQLVASRKARPRYAEGPLRDEAETAPGDGQLRIFEVDPAQISTQPEADAAEAPAPQWTSIWLDAPPEAAAQENSAPRGYAPAEDTVVEPAAVAAPPIQAASIQRRLAAAAINSAIVLVGELTFAATFVAISTRGIDWHPGGSRLQAVRQIAASIMTQTGLQPAQAAIIGVAATAFLILLYQALFFRFSEATPGMRCARIAFCTFDDENPTRRAIRRRLGAMLLSACPLGLGFASAMLDEDRLTWHDRMTKMYLRRY
jgi:RDD family